MLEPLFTPKAQLRSALIAGALLLLGVLLARGAGAGNIASSHATFGKALQYTSLALGLFHGISAAWGVLREGKFDIDVLMVVAAVLSAAIGHPAEGAFLLVLFNFSGALEDLAQARTRREIEALHALMPSEALTLRGGEFVPVAVEALVVGDRVRIRPGERSPTDAIVALGTTSMDQAAITGESVPRSVGVGDELFAGTVNVDDAIEAEVLRPASESSLQKILDLVTQAREQKTPVQSTIDRFEQRYSVAVMVLSAAVLLVWWLVLRRPLLPEKGRDAGTCALVTAITFLIVLSPCALVIATPTAMLAGIARAARAGVLVKGGLALAALAKVRAFALDKTGTITFGTPKLYEAHPVGTADGNHLLALAAGLERDSTHPIARAIVGACKDRGVEPVVFDRVDNVVAQGLEGTISLEGSDWRVRLGRYPYTESVIPVCFRRRVKDVLSKIQERGHIGVVIAAARADDPNIGDAGVLIMADAVRPGASELVAQLKALGITSVRMLTGDNRATAQRVAQSIHLDAFDAELVPEDKLRIVRAMQSELTKGTGVAVVGDGVNDAPALASADVGIAMGTLGTAAAMESADVVILGDSLAALPWIVRLARTTRGIILTNLTIAMGVIVLMGAATLVASYLSRPIPLAIGVLAHEGGTALVVLNALRILIIPGVGSARFSGFVRT